MKPRNPSFDPSTEVITSAPVWVRLASLPLHLWNLSSLKTIKEECSRENSES